MVLGIDRVFSPGLESDSSVATCAAQAPPGVHTAPRGGIIEFFYRIDSERQADLLRFFIDEPRAPSGVGFGDCRFLFRFFSPKSCKKIQLGSMTGWNISLLFGFGVDNV